MITALIVAAVCVGILIFYSVGSKMSQDEKNKYTSTTVQNTSTTQKVNPIDFTELKKTNSDIVGWIKIDNTDIDNPILRPDTEDDSYYLDHTYKQEYSSAGAIYMEKKNSGEFSDSVTVLYVHNWKNNGYFRPLYNFK